MGDVVRGHRLLAGDFTVTCHSFLQYYRTTALELAGFFVQDVLAHDRIVLLEFQLVGQVPLVLGSEIAVRAFSALQAYPCDTLVVLCHIPPRIEIGIHHIVDAEAVSIEFAAQRLYIYDGIQRQVLE
jgi:hypothetical protein